jgi:hypothetical protein
MERKMTVVQENPFGISYEGVLKYGFKGATLKVDRKNYRIADSLSERVSSSDAVVLDNHDEERATLLFLDSLGSVRISFPRVK